MRTRPLLLLCAAGLLVLCGQRAQAAPSRDDAGPALVFQMKSLQELFEATAKNLLADPTFKESEREALGKFDLKQEFKGIDTQKPLGFYATFDPILKDGSFSKSSAVLLIPVTDEKDFLAFLATLRIAPVKNGNIYSIQVSNSSIDATMRFQRGYAYIGFAGEKLDPARLLQPAELFSATETAVAALRFRLDRVPEDVKQAGLQFLGQSVEAAREIPIPPDAREFVEECVQMASRLVKLGLKQGKELAFRIDLGPKNGAFVAEFTIEGQPGSALAKSIAGIKPTKNDFTHIIGDDSLVNVVFQAPLFIEPIQRFLLRSIDIGAKQVDDSRRSVPAEHSDLASEALKALKRTVKSGDLDLAFSLRGPDKNERLTAIAAVSLKETAALEKSFKAALKLGLERPGITVRMDAFKVNGVNVHELDADAWLPPDSRTMFGKGIFCVAFAPDALFVTFGARSKELMREALSVKPSPKPAPLVNVEMNGKRWAAWLRKASLPVNEAESRPPDNFGQLGRVTLLSVKVEGGDKLVIRSEFGLISLYGGFTRVRDAAIADAQRRKAAPPEKVAPKKDKGSGSELSK